MSNPIFHTPNHSTLKDTTGRAQHDPNFVKSLQPTGTIIPLDYTLNKSGYWICCNFPESIPSSGAFYGNSKYVNRVDVPAGTHQLFFSYSSADQDIYLSVLVVKKNAGNAISFTKTRAGMLNSKGKDNEWSYVNGGSWTPYFASAAQPTVVLNKQGDSAWLINNFKKDGALFSGNVEFSVTGGALVFVFLHKTPLTLSQTVPPINLSSGIPEITGFSLYENENYSNISPITSSTPSYPNSGMYSGWGLGYKYAATIELDADKLAGNRYFALNTPNNASNIKINGTAPAQKSDLIGLNVAKIGNSSRVVDAGTPGQNLGNWSIMYDFTLKLYNTGSKLKSVNAYIQTLTAGTGEFPVIYSKPSDSTDGTAYYPAIGLYGQLTSKPEFAENNHASWNFVTIGVDAGTKQADPNICRFTYVLGTNSSHQKQMVFSN